MKDVMLKVSEYDTKCLILNRVIKKDSVTSDIEKIKIKLKNKNVFILVEGEEIYTKYLKVPKVNDKNLNLIIKNQLLYSYGKKAEEILYTYFISNKNKEDIEVVVFCINGGKLEWLRNCNVNFNLKKINLIQMCYIDYFRRYIMEKNYMIMFKHNSNFYIVALVNDKIIANKIISDMECIRVVDGLNYIISKVSEYSNIIKKIYYCNINRETFSKISRIGDNFEFINLGQIDEERILEYFIINRR